MTRLKYRLAVLLVPFVAASLACAGLGGGAAPNAAATVDAAATTGAGIAATAQAAFGVTPFAPTEAALPTSAAATPEATAAASGADTQTAPTGGTVVDPCSLMTTDEASAITGLPAGQPQRLGQACSFYGSDATSGGMGLYVLPASEAQAFLGQYVPALQANGITLDQTVVAQLAKDTAAGDMPAAVNDLVGLTTSLPGYEITKLDGVGSAAFWSWHTVDQTPEAALFAAQPGALVALIMMGAPTTQEAVAQPAMVTIAKRILANLPENFTLTAAP